MNNKERKEKGLPYHYDDPEIMGKQMEYLELLHDYNATRPLENEKKRKLLKQMFAEIGENCHIETPLHANWGCHHVHFGSGIYCNFNLTFVDDTDIYVGDHCMFGPNVVIATSGHPILPVLREHHYVYNLPVKIGTNVWIGAGVQILPGVTIGDHSVIGAGSVVTRDIPANVVAYGSPCRVIRKIGEKDKTFYFKDRKLDVWE
ncbi:sugar O-acetyltransferase [Sporolactobacillus terrae]|uniref:Acetyltransferase n=1 Tax=Sporolactobacillus terrae TaxID=269673 RepID=A0A410DCL3_9BACL|nr:sugar O-acetyltransferase [Sporolactobacillus terrae]QAA23876.1 sugar O-acetyltransferase [Sporolactobacillus terrae]QAA26847.1 sugar O-acetyltransferase [Sporolactobacillus terrae]UAK15907.1 sugar O-acetyltransferase [Sporolactobacillus terrae]BBO00415.1 galactoside O-acetyltransferase [Sporolactobacillus terrae]